MKRSALKADPEKVAAWRRRSQDRARNAPKKNQARKTRAKISPNVRREVLTRSFHRCIVCWKRDRLDLHHVLPVSRWPEFTREAANLVGVCRDCHFSHEGRSRPIPRAALPECCTTFAEAQGLGWYIERQYPLPDWREQPPRQHRLTV